MSAPPISQSSLGGNGISERHPKLLDFDEDYAFMNDSLAGERAIKEKNVAYLPPTGGMVADGMFATSGTDALAFNSKSVGYAAYSAYLLRAVYPSFVQDAVDTLIGVMHRESPVIELPPEMEPMRKVATRRGESLEMLLQKINENQLVKGRIGLLADVVPDRPTPHLVWYVAERVLNWDDDRETEFGLDKLKFLVLDETRQVRGKEGEAAYAWEEERRFRQCNLKGGVYTTFTDVEDEVSAEVTPQFRGRPLSEIPFAFIGSTDLDPDPARIPLLPIANLALVVYRGEADYRQCLFAQGQDTLVTVGSTSQAPGAEEPEKAADRRVGAGAEISLPLGGDAFYIGMEGKGLPEMAKSLAIDYAKAREAGSRLLEPRGSQAESGEALKIRVTASVANLKKIALVGAAGLEQMLKVCARWMGADPEKVKVIPNLDFAEAKAAAADALSLTKAVAEGLPVSKKSLHRWAAEQDFTKLTYDEEVAELEKDKKEREEEAAKAAKLEAEVAAATKPPTQPAGGGQRREAAQE